jgi:hypothetical protein
MCDNYEKPVTRNKDGKIEKFMVEKREVSEATG